MYPNEMARPRSRPGSRFAARLLASLGVHQALDPILTPVWKWFPPVIALGLMGTVLEGLGIGLLVPLLELISQSAEAPSRILPGPLDGMLPQENRALFLGVAIVILILLKNLVAYGNATLLAWIYGHSGDRLRRQLTKSLLDADSLFLSREPPHRVLNAISNESWRAADAVGNLLAISVAASASLIFVIFLFALSPTLTVVVLSGLILVQGAIQRLTANFRRQGEVVAAKNKSLAARMLHLVEGWRLIRLYGRQDMESDRFAGNSDEVRQAVFSLSRGQAALGPLTEVAYSLIFFMAALIAWRIGIPFPVVATFIVMLYRLQPQVRSIQTALAQLRGWSGSLDEVAWLSRAGTGAGGRTTSSSGPRPVKSRLKDRIALEDVDFRYGATDEGGLKSVDFVIPAGRATAIIGRSGSGKSTVVALLCGLYRPTRGRVTVDGRDLMDEDLAGWLSRVAVVGPELDLIEGSVEENIRYGDPHADRAAIERAAERADASDFIKSLPGGYSYEVGHRGSNLSAGQRQRIALSRALVRDPDVLILDEATNAMDVMSEVTILDMLRKLPGGLTTIIISHTAAVISSCDEYILLFDGRVAASGSTEGFDTARLMSLLHPEPLRPGNVEGKRTGLVGQNE
ncbi:ABC transporter ATP-binding protein [Wenxinia marina]|nr:ABC transporter ATP-binding protein [Wenxinia marina]